MSTKGTLILLALTLGLGAYIWFVEVGGKSSDERVEARARIVADFPRDRVTEIAIARESGRVVLKKEKDDWRIAEPVDFPADRGAVDAILSGLEFLEWQRRIDNGGGGDEGARKRADYGLDKPRATIEVKGAATPKLAIGADDPTGKNVYLARGEEAAVFAVEKHFFETLAKPLDDLRDKRALVFDRTKLKSLALAAGAARTRLTREKGAWSLAEPWKMLAATERVDQALQKIEDLKATHFLSDASGPVGAPARTIELDDGTAQTLTIGGPCPDRAGEVVAARKGRASAVFCLKQEDSDAVPMDAAALRETRLWGLRPDDLRKVRIEAGGRDLTLARESGAWWIALPPPAGAGPSGALPARQRAEDEAVRKFVEDLGSYRASEIVEAAPALDRPARVTLEPEEGAPLCVAFGAAQRGLVAVRRGDEPVTLRVPEEALGRLRADPLAFRSRRVLSFTRFDATRVEARAGATTGGPSEVAEKKDGVWKLAKPAGLAADDDQIDRVLGAMADLRAEAFVAPEAQPIHELGQPTRALTVTVEKPEGQESEGHDGGAPEQKEKGEGKEDRKKTYALTIGADAPDAGCYARAGGVAEPVFTLAAATCKDLRQLLVTRKLFDLEEDRLTGFVLRRAGVETKLEKRGPDWHRAGGPRVDKARIDGLVASLRNARAREATRYGVDPAAGLAEPRIAVTVKTDGKADQTLAIGAERKEGADVVGAYAKLAGRDVTYVVEKSLVDDLEKLKLE